MPTYFFTLLNWQHAATKAHSALTWQQHKGSCRGQVHEKAVKFICYLWLCRNNYFSKVLSMMHAESSMYNNLCKKKKKFLTKKGHPEILTLTKTMYNMTQICLYCIMHNIILNVKWYKIDLFPRWHVEYFPLRTIKNKYFLKVCRENSNHNV